jgi:membrane protease YdiL (CAAX protease family)
VEAPAYLRGVEVGSVGSLSLYCLLAPRNTWIDLGLFGVACLAVAYLGSRRVLPAAPTPLGSRAALALLAGFTGAGVVAMAVYAALAPVTLATTTVIARMLAIYVAYAFVQQFLTQRYLVVRVRSWLGDPPPWRVALVVALLFGVFHLPWPDLILPTIVAGFVWSWCYLRVGRVWPIALSHVALAVAFFVLVLGKDPFRAAFG